MAIAMYTNESMMRGCKRCGLSVKHDEMVIKACTFDDFKTGFVKRHWRCTPHVSPCGEQCMGGGARGKYGLTLLNTGKMHGLETPCPSCGGVRDDDNNGG